MPNEFERISYKKIRHLNVFLNHILYRNYHVHHELELLCVLAGSCRIDLGKQAIDAKAGSVVLINRSEAHQIQSAAGADFIVIQLSHHLLMDYFPDIRTTVFEQGDLTGKLCGEKKAELWQCVRALAADYLDPQPFFQLRCIQSAARLLHFLYANIPHRVCTPQEYLRKKAVDQRVDRIIEYIDSAYTGRVTLNELAEREGLTPTYFSHFFKEQFGIPFQEYLNNIRFEHSLRMVASEQMNLYEIALACGFSDVKYLTQAFRKKLGCTPKEYRRSAHGAPAPLPAVRGSERIYSDAEGLALLTRHPG